MREKSALYEKAEGDGGIYPKGINFGSCRYSVREKNRTADRQPYLFWKGNHILIDFPSMVSNQQVQLQMDAYHKVTEQQIPMTAATILYKSVFT